MNSWMSQLSNDTKLSIFWTKFDFHIQVDLFMELPRFHQNPFYFVSLLRYHPSSSRSFFFHFPCCYYLYYHFLHPHHWFPKFYIFTFALLVSLDFQILFSPPFLYLLSPVPLLPWLVVVNKLEILLSSKKFVKTNLLSINTCGPGKTLAFSITHTSTTVVIFFETRNCFLEK